MTINQMTISIMCVYVYTYVCVCVCIYARAQVRVCVYVTMYVCMYVYICMYACYYNTTVKTFHVVETCLLYMYIYGHFIQEFLCTGQQVWNCLSSDEHLCLVFLKNMHHVLICSEELWDRIHRLL